MPFRIFKQSEFQSMPWKNGGGISHEIFRYPEQTIDWQWRISTAEVSNAGPFSLFPGYQRSLTLLSGKGIKLNLNNQNIDIVPPHGTLNFSGDIPISAELLDGPTTDFNAIWQRSHFDIKVETRTVNKKTCLQYGPNITWFIYALSHNGYIQYENNYHHFDKGDAAWLYPSEKESDLSISTDGIVVWMEIFRL